jgi:hypothetical protein
MSCVTRTNRKLAVFLQKENTAHSYPLTSGYLVPFFERLLKRLDITRYQQPIHYAHYRTGYDDGCERGYFYQGRIEILFFRIASHFIALFEIHAFIKYSNVGVH